MYTNLNSKIEAVAYLQLQFMRKNKNIDKR